MDPSVKSCTILVTRLCPVTLLSSSLQTNLCFGTNQSKSKASCDALFIGNHHTCTALWIIASFCCPGLWCSTENQTLRSLDWFAADRLAFLPKPVATKCRFSGYFIHRESSLPRCSKTIGFCLPPRAFGHDWNPCPLCHVDITIRWAHQCKQNGHCQLKAFLKSLKCSFNLALMR